MGECALVVMDVQENVVPAFGGGPKMLQKINQALGAACNRGHPVFLGRVAFRPDYPEICTRKSLLTQMKEIVDPTEGASCLHPDLDQGSDDIQFTKR